MAKNRELESFAYSVSHDLRAPLRSIEGFSRALLEDYDAKLDEEGRDFLGRIINSAIRMDRLINDLLGYSRLGQRGVANEAVDMNKLVACALDEMKGDLEEAGARVDVEGPLPEVSGDPNLLLVLLFNLIGNAVKYRRPGVPPEVKISSRDAGKRAVFAVADNGIGLDMNYQNTVFQIFQRLHTEDDYPGTGIGLASARKVATAHGGRIWYESEPGKGATFFFELARREPDNGAGGGV
jgi:light-regulated signal transduction histidine kinase (bacteriophytochrome)